MSVSNQVPVLRPARGSVFGSTLVLSWAAVYSAVSPVLIFTLWQRLQG